jgi:hypothetical protein
VCNLPYIFWLSDEYDVKGIHQQCLQVLYRLPLDSLDTLRVADLCDQKDLVKKVAKALSAIQIARCLGRNELGHFNFKNACTYKYLLRGMMPYLLFVDSFEMMFDVSVQAKTVNLSRAPDVVYSNQHYNGIPGHGNFHGPYANLSRQPTRRSCQMCKKVFFLNDNQDQDIWNQPHPQHQRNLQNPQNPQNQRNQQNPHSPQEESRHKFCWDCYDNVRRLAPTLWNNRARSNQQ